MRVLDEHVDVSQSAVLPDPAPGLRVRRLEECDTPTMRAILKQHHATTVFRHETFSERKVSEHFERILSHPPGMIGPLAELNGRPVGGTLAEAAPYMLIDGPLFVSVPIVPYLTLPPVRRAKVFLALVAAIRQWAKSLNASHSFIHVTTGSNVKATDRLMRATGGVFVGGAYAVT